jgi:hypothetical protein
MAMPVIIEKIEVFIDFHSYAILEFDILIGYPLKNLIQEKPSQGSLNEKLEETTFATPISCLENPMAKQHSNHDQFEEVKFISLFISHHGVTEHSSPLSLKPKLVPLTMKMLFSIVVKIQ